MEGRDRKGGWLRGRDHLRAERHGEGHDDGHKHLVEEAIPEARRASQVADYSAASFHPDRTPSLFVNPEKQRWFCFGCKAGGDAKEFRRLYAAEVWTPRKDP